MTWTTKNIPMNTSDTRRRSSGAKGGPRSIYGPSRPTEGIIHGCRAGHRHGEGSFRDRRLTGLVARRRSSGRREASGPPRQERLKKWKDKTFAAGVDRKVIEKGAALMEVPLEELIADTIEGMRPSRNNRPQGKPVTCSLFLDLSGKEDL